MNTSETKKLLKQIIIATIFALIVFIPDLSQADEFSSTNFTVLDPVVDQGSDSGSSTNFGLGQSIGQIAIGQSSSTSFQLWSGFQYFFTTAANTLTATAGDAEVDLDWTVPATYLGIEVDSYEVGTGTTSGSYTFENVGNTTSFTKTGLTNDTPYFFIIRTLGPGGIFLVFSNEATATPTGAGPVDPGGGSSGSTTGGRVIFNGTAYPNLPVTLLKDAVIVSNTTANASGNFSISASNLTAGNYSFTLYATDANGVKSPNLNYNQAVQNSVTTTYNNVIVGPTLYSDLAQVRQTEPIIFSGYTAPNVPVQIYFSGAANFTAAPTSDASGFYSYELATGSLALGNYSARAQAEVNGLPSPFSLSLAFVVGTQNVEAPDGECRRSDLNCDTRVDLVDFSILLYYWEQTGPFANPRVDINNSGTVELRDLSIMLFDWTG